LQSKVLLWRNGQGHAKVSLPSLTRATKLGPDGCMIEAQFLHADYELW